MINKNSKEYQKGFETGMKFAFTMINAHIKSTLKHWEEIKEIKVNAKNKH